MKIIIVAAIIKDNKILLVNNHNYWGLPGGTQEPNETQTHTLIREFKEEFTGTQIINLKHYKNFFGISPRQNNLALVKVYFANIKDNLNKPDGSDEDIKEFIFTSNPFNYNLPPITKDIINSLIKDNHLKI